MSEDLKELQELAINEEDIVEATEEKDVLKELENIDFKNDNIDIGKYSSVLEGKERDRKFAESMEADNQVKELSPKYLEESCAININSTINSIEDLIGKYDVEKDLIKGMESKEIDEVYAIAKYFNLKLAGIINTMVFTIELKREEFSFIINAFRNSISYNGNDVLMIGDLKSLIDSWTQMDKELPKNVPSFQAEIDIKNLVIMYQFLTKHSVKGISKSFYSFAEIINKIKEANDLFNAFNIVRERVNSKFLVWAGATNTLEDATIQGEVQEPQEPDYSQEVPPPQK